MGGTNYRRALLIFLCLFLSYFLAKPNKYFDWSCTIIAFPQTPWSVASLEVIPKSAQRFVYTGLDKAYVKHSMTAFSSSEWNLKWPTSKEMSLGTLHGWHGRRPTPHIPRSRCCPSAAFLRSIFSGVFPQRLRSEPFSPVVKAEKENVDLSATVEKEDREEEKILDFFSSLPYHPSAGISPPPSLFLALAGHEHFPYFSCRFQKQIYVSNSNLIESVLWAKLKGNCTPRVQNAGLAGAHLYHTYIPAVSREGIFQGLERARATFLVPLARPTCALEIRFFSYFQAGE